MQENVTESDIRRMVEAFYARVQADPLLGPVFEARLAGRWPAHLDKMVNFWSRSLIAVGRYSGNPRSAHASIEGLDAHHFERWLSLFENTLSELFDPGTASWIHSRAQAMARGLLQGIGNRRPGLPMTEATKEDKIV